MGAAFTTPRVGAARYADIMNRGRLDLLLSSNAARIISSETMARKRGKSQPAQSSYRHKIEQRRNRRGRAAYLRRGNTNQMLGAAPATFAANWFLRWLGARDKTTASKSAGQRRRRSPVDVSAGQTITATEGKGVTASRPTRNNLLDVHSIAQVASSSANRAEIPYARATPRLQIIMNGWREISDAPWSLASAITHRQRY